MQIKDLIRGLDILAFNGSGNEKITGVEYDSRKVKQGSLFACICSVGADGHDYIDHAIKNGAAVILASKPINPDLLLVPLVPVIYVENTRSALAHISAAFFGFPAKKLKLIGVTGTNGKTTVTYLIKTILEHAGKKVGLIGTNQNLIGDRVVQSSYTTPESSELHGLFGEMVQSGVEYVVMEVSSHALEFERVGGCEFETAIFTNLTQDHLDFHHNMESYYGAKRKLFNMCKSAVINIDDEYGERLAAEVLCECYTYAIDNSADLCATDIKLSARGISFTAVGALQDWLIRLSMPGRFSVYNALAAASAALMLGFSAEDAQKGLIIAQGVKGRAEVVGINKDYTVIIDFAHTPDGLKNIISTVQEFAKGKVVVLFGCGGDRDSSKRALMGLAAGSLADFCIVTSDNPRTESPDAIIAQIIPGVVQSGCEYVAIENRKDAIQYALDNAKEGDVIILAGKGHETYQIIGTTKYDFDEREIVKSMISGM